MPGGPQVDFFRVGELLSVPGTRNGLIHAGRQPLCRAVCAACAMYAHVHIRISLQMRCSECVFFVCCSGSALLQQCQEQVSPEALMRGAKHVTADMPYMDEHDNMFRIHAD